jgi:hypothetical protein
MFHFSGGQGVTCLPRFFSTNCLRVRLLRERASNSCAVFSGNNGLGVKLAQPAREIMTIKAAEVFLKSFQKYSIINQEGKNKKELLWKSFGFSTRGSQKSQILDLSQTYRVLSA